MPLGASQAFGMRITSLFPKWQLLALVGLLMLTLCRGSTTDSSQEVVLYPAPALHNDYWVDYLYGDDSNNGTLDWPYKTLAKAVGVVWRRSAISSTVHLYSGVYSIDSWETPRSAEMTIRTCLECPRRSENEGRNSTILIQAPVLLFAKPMIVVTSGSTLNFVDIDMMPKDNAYGEINTISQLFQLERDANVTLTRSSIKYFFLTGDTTAAPLQNSVTLFYFISAGGLTFNDCVIERNVAILPIWPVPVHATTAVLAIATGGSRITFNNTLVARNFVSATRVLGGVVQMFNSVVSAYHSTFLANVAAASISGYGAVFGTVADSKYYFESCVFASNVMNGSHPGLNGAFPPFSGGAIQIPATSDSNIYNTTFVYNYAYRGGAIAIDQKNRVHSGRLGLHIINNCTFTNNRAETIGSAISADGLGVTEMRFFDILLQDNLYVGPIRNDGVESTSAIFIRQAVYVYFSGVTIKSRDLLSFPLEPMFEEVDESEFLVDDLPPPSLITRGKYGYAARIAIGEVQQVTVLGLTLDSYRGSIGILPFGGLFFLQDVATSELRDWAITGSIHTTETISPVPSVIYIGSDSNNQGGAHSIRNFNFQPFSRLLTLLHAQNLDTLIIEDSYYSPSFITDGYSLMIIENSLNFNLENCEFLVRHPTSVIVDGVKSFRMLHTKWSSDSNVHTPELLSVTNTYDVLILDCHFSSIVGAATVRIQDPWTANIVDSTWSDCSASELGGTVTLDRGRNYRFENCTFVNCSATNGGAISTWSPTYIENCKFINNSATMDGGALYAKSGVLQIFNSEFIGNQAVSSGGAISYSGSPLILGTSIFRNNIAQLKTGGALSLSLTGPVTTSIISGTVFECNRARLAGGAIGIDGAWRVLLNTVNFTKNVAGPAEIALISKQTSIPNYQSFFGYGGAIWARSPLHVTTCNFYNNTANIGGAIHTEWRLRGAIIDDFYIGINSFNSTYVGNIAASSGGAIASDATDLLKSKRFSHREITPNTGLDGNLFVDNVAYYYGGAIANYGLRINMSCGMNQFYHNSARFGGALYYSDRNMSTPIISSHLFLKNEAEGGAIGYFDMLDEIKIPLRDSYCIVNSCQNNTVTGWGPVMATGFFQLHWYDRLQLPFSTPEDMHLPATIVPNTIWPVPNMTQMCYSNSNPWPPANPFPHLPPQGPINEKSTYEPMIREEVDSLKAKIRAKAQEMLESLRSRRISRLDELDLYSDPSIRYPVGEAIYDNVMSDTLDLKKRDALQQVKKSVFAQPWMVFDGVPMHSGYTNTWYLMAVDQMAQTVQNLKAYPMEIALYEDVDKPCANPRLCKNVSMVDITPPALLNGKTSIDVQLILLPDTNPRDVHQIYVGVKFSQNVASPAAALDDRVMYNVSISGCPIGYGFQRTDSSSGVCLQCPYGSYSLNYNGNCTSCLDAPNLQCAGSTLTTDDDYWVYTNAASNQAGAYLCPLGYCRGKQPSPANCAANREGTLCVQCARGYSESLFSACTSHCNRINYFLIVVAIIGLWLAVLIIHTIIAASSGKSTILFYFVQTCLLFASDIPLSPTLSDSGMYLCVFPMNPLTKRLTISLLAPAMLILLLLTFLVHRLFVTFIRPALPPKWRCGTVIDDLPFFQELNPRLATLDMKEDLQPILTLEDDSPHDATPIATEKSPATTSAGFLQTSSSVSSDDFNQSSPAVRSDVVFVSPSGENDLVLLGDDQHVPTRNVVDSPSMLTSEASGSEFDMAVTDDDGPGSNNSNDEAPRPSLRLAPDALLSESQPVPSFGFELDDEEENPLDMDWHTVDASEDEKFHSLRAHQHASARVEVPTLRALRLWLYETRFFHSSRLIRTTLSLALFTYSSFLGLALSLVDCVHIADGPYFLKLYPSILCDSPQYRAWRYSLIGLVPICVAIFCYVTVKLFWARKHGQLNQADVKYGILYEMYKTEFFFWKLVELLRRTVISMLFILVNDSPLVRGISLSFACALILIIQALAWPYRRNLENSLETLSTFSIAAISISSIWYHRHSTRLPALITWIIIIVTTTIIIVAFGVSIIKRRILPLLRKLQMKLFPPSIKRDSVADLADDASIN